MALTGHLSDLSLSELIEFFCNQRKTGQLKVLYPQGPGYFQLQSGSVVDARIGVLRGIDAVYFALTLPNAAFEFSGAAELGDRTINQPWTQVVLEGLRRLDEGMVPPQAFPEDYDPKVEEPGEPAQVEAQESGEVSSRSHVRHMPAFLSRMSTPSASWRKPLLGGAVACALLASVAAIGVPAGWYGRSKTAAPPAKPAPVVSEAPATNSPATDAVNSSNESDSHASDAAALAQKKQHERERARAREAAASAPKPAVGSQPSTSENSAKSGPKKATVTVSYDEAGRVTQASGADATAVRIARQKRFPPGKAGTTTITIPLN